MDSQDRLLIRPRDIPVAYRLMRAILRCAAWLFFPRVRSLNQEGLDRPGPKILLVTHPQSLTAALLLIATLDRQVHCLLPSRQLRGVFRKLAGWALGMRSFDSLSEEADSLFIPCLGVLANQGVLALFAHPFSQNSGRRAPGADFAARLTVEAILQRQGEVQPTICTVHWFLGAERRGQQPLMWAGSPIQPEHFLPKVGENHAEASRHLAETVQEAIAANIFGLEAPEVERFYRELEGFSREYLRQQWSRRPEWKQRPEELQLSSFARKWVDEQNRTDPARLVNLRESLDDYREARRKFALAQFKVEASGPWHTSGLRMAAAWIETVLGFPVALYGLINHIPAGIILRMNGLFKHSPQRDPKVEWLLRLFIVLSFYTVQVFLADIWWGRATAGYYTLTLPFSGAYLFRYRWLLRRRTHLLLLKALLPFRSARLLRRQESILGKLSRELERSSESPGVPCEPSPDPAE